MDQLVQAERVIRQNLLMSSAVFIEESLKFISSIVSNGKLSQERGRRYIKEILHSIFFIGYINKPPIHPVNVLRVDLHSKLSEKFPDVFQSYTSQLPLRPPFSVLLEVVVETTLDRNVFAVLQKLAELIRDMVVHRYEESFFGNDFCLGASVVSFCYYKDKHPNARNYFGASVGCKGKMQKMIFIDLACIQTWNRNVAYAVCLAERHDTSITLPTAVFSAAYRVNQYNIYQYESVPPCLHCRTLFPSVTFLPVSQKNPRTPSWQYGNCAECEAISNLLNAEPDVSGSTEQLNANLPHLEKLLLRRANQLRQNMEGCQFDINPEFRFYNPEQHNSATL